MLPVLCATRPHSPARQVVSCAEAPKFTAMGIQTALLVIGSMTSKLLCLCSDEREGVGVRREGEGRERERGGGGIGYRVYDIKATLSLQ